LVPVQKYLNLWILKPKLVLEFEKCFLQAFLFDPSIQPKSLEHPILFSFVSTKTGPAAMPFSPLTGPPGVISLLHSPKPSPPHPSAPPLHALPSVALLCSVVEEMKRRLCRLLFPHESAPKCLPSLSFLTLKRMVLNVHWPLPSSLPATSTHHRDPIKGTQEHPISPYCHLLHHFTTSTLHVALSSSLSAADLFLLVAGQNQPSHHLH
jgi:hypothetical protein